MTEQIIKEFNGNKFSRIRFDGYTHRFKVVFETGSIHVSNMDIYTDTDSREVVSNFVDSAKTKKVISFKIVHVASKEQDDLTAKFIEETLKDL
jgi:DNA-binding ferritin-like protein